jgi:hypothetical protein
MVASKCWSTFRRFWRTTRRQRLSSTGWASETSVDLTGPFSHTNFRRRPDRRFAPTAADGERGGKDAHDDPGGRPYIRACETSRNAGSVRHSSSPRSATCLLSRALDPAHFRRVSKARPTAAGLRQLRGLLPYPEAAPSRDRRPGQGGSSLRAHPRRGGTRHRCRDQLVVRRGLWIYRRLPVWLPIADGRRPAILRADRRPPRHRHRRVPCHRCPLNVSVRAGAGRGDPSVHNGAERWRPRSRTVRPLTSGMRVMTTIPGDEEPRPGTPDRPGGQLTAAR